MDLVTSILRPTDPVGWGTEVEDST